MKMKNIYKFAIDGMIDRKKTFIYTLIILIMSMVMMNLVLLQVDNLYYLKLRLNDSFDKNLSEVYYVSTAEDIDETYRSFIESIVKDKYIDCYGFYRYKSHVFYELENNIDYIKIVKDKYGDDKNYINENQAQVLYIDNTLSSMCNIYDTNGNRITNKITNEEYIPLYIGNNLRNVIPVGTVLSSYKRIKVNNRFQKEKIKFKVIGILQKDSKWLEDINIEVMNSVIDLDNKFVAIQPYNSEDNMGRCLYTLKGDNAKKIFNKDVMKSARDNKLLVKANTVKEEVSNTIKSDIKELKVYIVFAVFIILVSVLAISSISTVSLLLRKRDYGIMYANGMSMQDVRKIVITENIVKILVSFILSQLYILYDLFMNYSGRNEIGLSNLLYIQSKVTVYQMIGIASIVLIISVIVPLYMINRLKITEMIGAND